MKKLSIIMLNGKNNDKTEDIEVICSNGKDIMSAIENATGEYITIINNDDSISNDYIDRILEKISVGFDCLFINYTVMYNYSGEIKLNTNEGELKNNKPYFGEYVWNYVYKKDKLQELLKITTNDVDFFNKKVDELFRNVSAIGNIIYYHQPNGNSILNDFPLRDYRQTTHYKNVIFIQRGANGLFNGYISWLNNIGRCFGNDYDITILYTEMPDVTLERFLKYFRCVKYDDKVNYTSDRLFVCYNIFYYPKNIYPLEANYMFIHGNMSDYERSRKFHYDIYTKYIAVSKTAALKAKGYFNTDKIDYILNPIKIDEDQIKPHLTLVSAQRSGAEKRVDRIEKLASVFDELEIPYTWNLFTDKRKLTNNGLIYRQSITNTLPYVKNSDYLVLLSDSESYSYAVVEALELNTKVVVTPLPVFDEIGVVDGDNAFVIPFEYFEDENRDKLREMALRIYTDKNKNINFKFDPGKFEDYRELFK